MQRLGVEALCRCKGPQTLVAGRWMAGRDDGQLWAQLPGHEGRQGQQLVTSLIGGVWDTRSPSRRLFHDYTRGPPIGLRENTGQTFLQGLSLTG
jgi:hypothetical protein